MNNEEKVKDLDNMLLDMNDEKITDFIINLVKALKEKNDN